ncbi:hypothetical protein [Roseivirga sp.]|uniref:hypothetical protein n=1 Tax=Roseivirga sp. TaxID=1964215 RepID=UPI003B8B5D05
MKLSIIIKTLALLGVVMSFSGADYSNAELINTNIYHANSQNEDKVIIHMKEAVKDASADVKEQSTKNYVLAIKQILGFGSSELTPEKIKYIRRFASDYLNADFKSEEELIGAFRMMVSSVLGVAGLPDCDGEWIGSAGYLNNCDDGTEIIFAGIPTGACSYECLDPYLVIDCVLYAPCIPK